MEDPNRRVWDKLNAATPPGGSCLQTFLDGLVDSHFQWEIETFVGNRACEFLAVNVDGSHKLSWQEYHTDYRCIFENQIEKLLKRFEISEDDFISFCSWLKTQVDAAGDDSLGLYQFLEVLTASEDYDTFLAVMFAEARKQEGQARGQTVELDVLVPEGVQPGQTIAIEYLGTPSEVTIPDGIGSGGYLRTSVVLA
eukprot:TRINITY_DN96290_c0_g1_i1.p1 TRINITY_DN96290_c0_g1~~TRINITY_DN96290_c0_g1_i1.p1  ORF type:complete len:210 (-),score=45.71 TRINITY_DN96290_c0_g1_i1:42-629(-)